MSLYPTCPALAPLKSLQMSSQDAGPCVAGFPDDPSPYPRQLHRPSGRLLGQGSPERGPQRSCLQEGSAAFTQHPGTSASPRRPPKSDSRAHRAVSGMSSGQKGQIRTQISTSSTTTTLFSAVPLGKLSHLPASRAVLRLRQGQKPSIFKGPCNLGSFPSHPLGKEDAGSSRTPGQSPGKAHRTALPPVPAKPRLQKEGTPTLGISIDLEDIGMRGGGW